ASVNRAAEFVGGLDRHDVAQLADTEQRCDTRQQVLAESRGRTKYVRVVGGSRRDLRREDRRERFLVRSVLDLQHTLDALDRSRLSGHGSGVIGEHRDIDLCALNLARAGHALGRCGIELAVRMFGNDENLGHYSKPFCLSASTSPATSFTMMPFCRDAGGAWFSVLN